MEYGRYKPRQAVVPAYLSAEGSQIAYLPIEVPHYEHTNHLAAIDFLPQFRIV